VVIEGARRHSGMRAFNEAMTPDLAEAIRLYVISQANAKSAKAEGEALHQ
jgi:hypothetical protein